MTDQKRTRKFVFGNERFGGSYTPGEFQFNFPEDMTREDFEKMFSERMDALYRKGNDLKDEFFDNSSKRKENLKPLSIRVKPHTKEFFKNHSILSPRDVLEMYEEFNNGSEAFINSLLEEEKQLENELSEIQEKLHNAKLFKDKLVDLKPENEVLTDQDKLIILKQKYDRSEVKEIGNETSLGKAQNDIIRDIQIYNTLIIRVYDNQVLSIGVYTNAEPVVYYFKNEYSDDDISEILNHVEEYCKENEIEFSSMQNSLFDE
ncbi:MAG: hypothetical protein IJ258_03050 [Methanobrevibacter sp.]|uniref:hypothetical protein n=1 Tax=Methanobrevibacter sp. TaxID=66852 RepID=UPI0025F47A37|nr:hypothetical protein [Methanobrevibacter sp.]MBQ8017063.1 hypothetical protein [Methanobrevibacter sp.]